MRVFVRLFGTLAGRFPDHDPVKGIEIDLPGGAVVADLLEHLGISGYESGVVAVDGRVSAPDDPLPDQGSVNILQKMHGG